MQSSILPDRITTHNMPNSDHNNDDPGEPTEPAAETPPDNPSPQPLEPTSPARKIKGILLFLVTSLALYTTVGSNLVTPLYAALTLWLLFTDFTDLSPILDLIPYTTQLNQITTRLTNFIYEWSTLQLAQVHQISQTNTRKLQLIEPVWVTHESFQISPPHGNFPQKKWKGKTLFQVNALHDTAATMNLIAGELVSATQAVMTPEPYLRKVRTVHGEKVEQYEFLDLLIFDSSFQDITSTINDTRF